MYVETSRSPGKGKLTLTGQLGEVMRESAQLALTWLRAKHRQYVSYWELIKKSNNFYKYQFQSIPEELFTNNDTHIHMPAGSISKDGPSAGITILVALLSLYSGKSVRAKTAMTGEITLRGALLPVGGIKAKVLAAHRAGIERVILPKRNEMDVNEITEDIKVGGGIMIETI